MKIIKFEHVIRKGTLSFDLKITPWISIWSGYYSGEGDQPLRLGITSNHESDFWWYNFEIGIWKITFLGISISSQ